MWQASLPNMSINVNSITSMCTCSQRQKPKMSDIFHYPNNSIQYIQCKLVKYRVLCILYIIDCAVHNVHYGEEKLVAKDEWHVMARPPHQPSVILPVRLHHHHQWYYSTGMIKRSSKINYDHAIKIARIKGSKSVALDWRWRWIGIGRNAIFTIITIFTIIMNYWW